MPPRNRRLTGLMPANRMRNAVGNVLLPIWKWTKFGQIGLVRDTKLPTANDTDLQNVDIQFTGTPIERALAAETSSWATACLRFRIAENHEYALVDRR